MKTALLILFGVISLALGVFALLYERSLRKAGKWEKRIFSTVQVYTVGVFLSVVCLFIPIYYTSYQFGDAYSFVRPFLIAIHNSFRVFILDGEFDVVVKALSDQSTWLRVCWSFYAAVLYVAAPVLTFTNVLSLFKNVKGEFQYMCNRTGKCYIMSELNIKSVALAKSIRKKNEEAMIVFTDVFGQNEEKNYELLAQARDMKAICLKKDIAHVDITSRKGDVEVFLIGNDESESISQAVRITTDLNKKNKKHNVKVFVFSTKPGAAHIVDSIKYENLLQHASDSGFGEDSFKLRRIDEKQQLIWNTIPDMKLYQVADRHDKTLSVMIVGFGSYGEAFFKTLVWYCQFEGYKLQIHVLDKKGDPKGGKNDIQGVINRSCPELLEKNRSQSEGDAQYDIEIIPGVDVLTSDLDELIAYDGDDPEKLRISARLKSTNLVFVSLGDDDLNIEVSIYLRSLFDRVNAVVAKKEIDWNDEQVDIYSVVFDDQKSKILYNKKLGNGNEHLLLNHQNVPYHICFIGSMSSQFDYGNIYNADLEQQANKHHSSWVAIEEKIYKEWQQAGDQDNLDKYEWYYEAGKTSEAVEKAKRKYEQYEYYRNSSIAKELYQREIQKNPALVDATTCLKEGKQTCQCENCIRRKRSEHRRWNAYMRVTGFSYQDGKRADRARLHNMLCDWKELSELERLKD